jgi:hypothetical protein
MARDKPAAKRRAPAAKNTQPPKRIPVRVAPTDDPAETVERLLSRRQLIVEDGDVVVVRESAGLWRGTGVVGSLSGPSSSQYRLIVRGQQDDIRRVYATYERGVVDGEALAAARRVRLFYAEDMSFTLLKDYRPTART